MVPALFCVVPALFCPSCSVPKRAHPLPPPFPPSSLLLLPPPSSLFPLGNGTQASCGVGELLARHVVGAEIPAFGQQLLPGRFLDKAYCDELTTLDCKGQI